MVVGLLVMMIRVERADVRQCFVIRTFLGSRLTESLHYSAPYSCVNYARAIFLPLLRKLIFSDARKFVSATLPGKRKQKEKEDENLC